MERLRGALLWLTGFAGAIVFMEPSPYEVTSLLTIFVFACTGLALRPALMPLIVMLLLYNTGFSLAVVQVTDQTKPLTWVAVSWYLSATAIFFAAMLGTNTQERLSLLMRGTIDGGGVRLAASRSCPISALLGPLSDLFLMYGRAHATFNDPNVLGAFLVLPALLALQRVLNGRLGDAFRASILFGLIAIAVLLTFSRAAWGQFALTTALLMFLTFVTSRSPNERAAHRADRDRRRDRDGAGARGAACRSTASPSCSRSARASTSPMTSAISAASAATCSARSSRSTGRSASARCSSTRSSPRTRTTPISTPSCRAAGSPASSTSRWC